MNISDVRKYISGVRGNRDELREKKAKLAKRIEDLKTLARPRDEVADLVCARIDELAALHPARFACSLHNLIHQPMDPPQPDADDEGTCARIPVATTTGHNRAAPTAKTVERALFFLLNDQIKAGVRKAIAEMPYPDAVGPGMADRLKEISRAESELAATEAQIKSLEDELTAALRD